MKKILLLLALAFCHSFAMCQIEIDELGSLVGTWKSEIDQKYKDHPMIKKFNPELKGQLTTFRWGVENKIIHMSIYDLDKPNEGDTTLIIEGMIVPNPFEQVIKLIEFGGDSEIYFEGKYDLDKDGNIVRHYEASFDKKHLNKFRERWEWEDDSKTSFLWYTDTFRNGTYEQGDIVVRYVKLNKSRKG